jgi:hypothetical protein
MKSRDCPFLEGCPMFQHFQRFTQRVYMGLYCQGFYHDCKRREMKLSGKEVPTTLLPNGGTLWNVDEPAPEPIAETKAAPKPVAKPKVAPKPALKSDKG